MKKILLIMTVIFITLYGCKKFSVPVAPDTAQATATPLSNVQITQTAIALQTAGLAAQQTATMQAQQTATAQATQTATAVMTVDSAAIVSVPGGTFTQSDGTNSFSHTISTFKMGKYQVTYDLWYTVYQWAIINGYTFANAGREGAEGTIGLVPTNIKYEPVTTVNWRDAIVWCNAYSQKSGLTPVYCSDAGLTTPIKDSTNGAYGSSVNTTAGSFDNPYVNWSTNGYRLPTEGEYQYAASYKDGTSWTPYNYASGATASYDNVMATGLVGWYSGNSWDNRNYYVGYITHNVGGKTANSLGIYDMSGNVWEWCWDWYDNYPGTSTNYRGPTSGGLYSGRVMRGGGYDDGADGLQVGYRYDYVGDDYPSFAFDYNGFRFARTY
jgi:formylglycine-generating enzyme required for sulfatase activity